MLNFIFLNSKILFYFEVNFFNQKSKIWKKNIFLPHVAANFLLVCVFQLFSTKNVENADFNHHLECAAPKLWSKYTIDCLCTKYVLILDPHCRCFCLARNSFGVMPFLVVVLSFTTIPKPTTFLNFAFLIHNQTSLSNGS